MGFWPLPDPFHRAPAEFLKVLQAAGPRNLLPDTVGFYEFRIVPSCPIRDLLTEPAVAGGHVHAVGQGEAGEGPERFFGRPVVFHCKLCERVKIAGPNGASQEAWQKESVALQAHGIGPDDVWWFHTRCDSCQVVESKSVAI